MASKTHYVCSACGYESGKWLGRCPDCSAWNSFSEVTVQESPKGKTKSLIEISSSTVPEPLSKVKSVRNERISTGFLEFDRVLGGGVVSGSVVLLSGDPGIGKSTLLLELALNISQGVTAQGSPVLQGDVQLHQIDNPDPLSRSSLSERKHIKSKTGSKDDNGLALNSLANGQTFRARKVLYITGEESESQLKLRAERILGIQKDPASAKASAGEPENLFVFSTGDVDRAIEACERVKPNLIIVDSIQTMASETFPGFPGSLPQIRHATSRFVSYAKTNAVPVFLIGHVTKEGIVAGPMLLSHMVDAVLYLEGQALTGTKILRAFKNRFGDTTEVGIFVMEEKGLVEISDTANFFMENTKKAVPGSCLTVVMEGSRPLTIEIQALVVPSNLSFPRRVSSGIGDKRLELLLAVIQKHLKVPLDRMDVFVNVVGGLRITETAVDLAVCLAVLSSVKNRALPSTIAIAEVGLLGELKNVMNETLRVKEAKKLGFKNIITQGKFRYLSDIMGKL